MCETEKMVHLLGFLREVRDLKEGEQAQSSDARSSTSEAAPSPSPTPPGHPSRPPLRGPSPAPSRNERCVHMDPGTEFVDAGDQRFQADQPDWSDMWKLLTEAQANHEFLQVCQHCCAACRGKYARQVLAKFLHDKNELVEGNKWAVLTKQAVWGTP